MEEIEDSKTLVEKSAWTSDRIAELLGYEDGDKPKNTEKSEVLSGNENDEIDDRIDAHIETDEIIEQSELFDNDKDVDPHLNKTKHNFSNSPFTKFASVGLIMFLVFGIGGAILNAMMSEAPTVAPSIYARATKSPSEKVDQTDPEKEKLENGRLKASLALSKQVEKVKAVEESKKNSFQISKIKKEPKTSEKKSVQPSVSPVAEKHTEMPTKYNESSSNTGIINKPNKSQIVKKDTSPVGTAVQDPIAQLETMNRLGSYGSEVIPQPEEKLNDQNSRVDTQATLQDSPINSSLKNVTMNSPVEQTQFLSEESKIINGTNNKNYLKVGTIFPGKLLSPLVWVEKDTQNSSRQKIVIVTTKAVKKQNRTVLPANAEIITKITNIQSGVVELQPEKIVFNDQEYSIPPGVLAINADKGKPLIASKWNNKSGLTARDAEIFLLGSLTKVGDVLNQPRSQKFSSNSGFGSNSSFSSIERGRGNVLGAILSGGFSPLTKQILQRNQKALQQKINSESKVWFLKANTKIEIFVNESFSLN